METIHYGEKSAEIGGETARPKKQEIAQTSNTEPQVEANTVRSNIMEASTAILLMKNSCFELTIDASTCAEKIPWQEHKN